MYQADVLVNSPRMASGYKCRECHMNFQSQHLLTKHKQKFCVGSTADPDDLQLRRGLWSESPRRIISPEDRPFSDSLLLNKKLYQLRRLKEKRSRDRDLRDLEERILLDDLENREGQRSPRKSRIKIPLSKYPEIRDLQLEYEKLREKENLTGRKTVPARPVFSRNDRETPYSRNSNSSISIHLEDEYRRNPNQDQQLRSLAENHGRQMEYLQLRNRDLEKQREDIRRRLEGLGRKALVPEPHHDNTADLLRELREQEIRNQRALDDLKRQLHDLSGNQRVNVMDVDLMQRNISKTVKVIQDIERVVYEQWKKKCEEKELEMVAKATKLIETNIVCENGKESGGEKIRKSSEKDRERTPEKTKQNEKVIDSQTVEKHNPLSGDGENVVLESKGSNWKNLVCQQLLKCKDDLRSSVGAKSQERRQQLLLEDLNILKNIVKNSDKYGYSDVVKGPHGSPKTRTISDNREFMDNLEIKANDLRDKSLPCPTAGVQSQCREIEKPVYPQAPPPPAPPSPRRPFVMPVFYGKSLVAEIIAIRQAYLQNGGNDPDVLSQMAQMQAEAQAIEDQMNQKPPEKHREKPKDNATAVHMLEIENDRLNQELRLLQEQNLLAQNRNRKSDKEDELERELRRLQREHLEKMYGLQRELDDLRMLLMMDRNRPGPPPQTTHFIQQPQPPVSLGREHTPWLLQKPYVEVEPMAPYDQYAGFVIFYDFVLSLDPTIQACRLVVGLHSSSAVMGEPTVLPTVYTEPATRGERYNYNYSNAVIGAKQPVPKCPPESDLGLVVELQASGGPASEHDRHSLITRAWTKVPLFDNNGRLIAGRFRIPMRNVPIKPFLHVSQVQRIPKYGDADLYYRIVNMRDAEIHSMQQITAANYNQYTYPQIEDELIPVYSPKRNIPPPPSASPLPTPRKKQSVQSVPQSPQRLPSIPPRALRSTSPAQTMALQDTTLGFQVDRVKKAESGEGKIKITAYYASTGKVVDSATSPVTCSTTSVKSNFKYGYHVFGQQEATFQDVNYQGDMILIARFYLKRREVDVYDEFQVADQGVLEPTLYDEESCVAWAALPLVICDDSLPLKKRKTFNPNFMSINQGTHTIPLYEMPVPEPGQIPLDGLPRSRDWARYGKATLRVYVFQGTPRPGSLTPSDVSDIEGEDTLPEFAWLPLERKTPPKDPFLLGDGFDVYIDGCRFLPDSSTFTKVAGRILDRRYELYGKDINTGEKLDSDVYNPVYEEKIEFRETNIPPTATLLLKVYTIDNFYKSLTVVGYATLNVFVETGTERQPNVDKPMQVSLNEGAHQLRLYSQGPNGVDPLSEHCLRDSGVRIVPCASLLVRLVKVTRGAGGKALESSKVPQSDWLRMGLMQPRPKYSDRVYYSSRCTPTRGETRLFHSMMRRTKRTVREVITLVAPAKESYLRSDKTMEEFMKTQLTKTPDIKPLDQDLNFVCQYSPKHGIKVAIDSAVNLPWTNFTHAHMCFNPPAAFYLGAPHATYDKLMFTEILDTRSTNTSPAWKDGFKHFPRRSFHRFLTLIIHIQEISVNVSKENYKYGLLEQAWTAVQIFTDKYCTTQAFQLPLFAGSPSQTILKQLAREPCKEWMERMIRNNGIHLLEGSSVFVRIADARRDDELLSDIAHNKLVEVNTDYIPVGLEESYSRERPGKPLETLVPVGKTPEQFMDNLKVKFKSLVYKLYEEGNIEK
ncbi:uncharacterized protein LOC127862678 isoform X3 [Dreissena polymorpha]|uniref:uncharacterized protein LOC127862678 isoform X3 n=1 Tax=Dreissena polymorpha TaxID=45954 RepID=UPI0022654934|nr:uncharacterized protein LOC127862678 isoform X3 [Dreissena polymorpha]